MRKDYSNSLKMAEKQHMWCWENARMSKLIFTVQRSKVAHAVKHHDMLSWAIYAIQVTKLVAFLSF
jgi:hypothetical protein